MAELAKELVRLSSLNATVFLRMQEKMTHWISLDGFNPAEIDSATAPRRGRPRRTGHSQPNDARPLACPLYGKANPLSSCSRRGILDEVMADNPGPKNAKRKAKKECRICHYIGHDWSSCPYLEQSRELIRISD
jgi:hypothetical protein